MTRFKDRQKAIQLRIEGKSYSQIKAELGVSKSTLSCWLKDFPLTAEKIRELRDKNPRRIEKYIATRARKKRERLDKIYEIERKKFRPLTKKALFMAGLFLYWGEGTKTMDARLSVSNTNPAIIKFFIKWLTESLGVPKEKLRVYLHLYSDMVISREIAFWSEILVLSPRQFTKPYIKKSSRKMINYKNTFKHGTCNVIIGDARLTERILINLKVIEEEFIKC